MKNSNPLERDIEKRVVAHAKSLGMLCYKFTSPACRSVPDRMFITKEGVVFFIEFKRLGQKPTSAQEVEIAKIRAQGVKVFVVDNVGEGKRIVEWMGSPKEASEFTYSEKLRKALTDVVDCCTATDDYSDSALLGARVALEEDPMSDPLL